MQFLNTCLPLSAAVGHLTAKRAGRGANGAEVAGLGCSGLRREAGRHGISRRCTGTTGNQLPYRVDGKSAPPGRGRARGLLNTPVPPRRRRRRRHRLVPAHAGCTTSTESHVYTCHCNMIIRNLTAVYTRFFRLISCGCLGYTHVPF